MKRTLIAIVAACAAVFGLTARADLPSGYTQLDWVETDGATYVDTGFTPSLTNAIEIQVQMLKSSSDAQVLACTRSSSGMPYEINATSGNQFQYVFSNGKTTTLPSDGTFSLDTTYTLGMSPDTSASSFAVDCVLDGVTNNFTSGYSASNKPSHRFFLFVRHQAHTVTAGTYATCRFYSFKVWDDRDKGNLLCDIVPVFSRADLAVGLYDLVARKFLPATGGTLTPSPDTLEADEYREAIDASTNTVVDLAGYDLTAATIATNSSSAVAGSDYQDLEYIEATGTQAIQITDFKIPGAAKVELKFRPTTVSSSTYQFLFYSRKSNKNLAYSGLLTDKLRFDFYDSQTAGTNVFSAARDYTLVLDGSSTNLAWSVNGTAEKTIVATNNTFTSGGDLFLFNSNVAQTGTNQSYCRLYYFRVTTNDVALLDLYPVRRLEDGVLGLYDKIGSKFYTSGTSTAFYGLATPAFTNSSETVSALNVGQKKIPGYTVVECITAADGGAYIDTGIVPYATDCAEMKAGLTDFSASYGLFCSRASSSSQTFNALYLGNSGSNSGIRFDFNDSSKIKTGWTPGSGESFTVKLDGNAKTVYTNGVSAGTFSSNDFTPSARLYLFALHNNGSSVDSHPKGSIYYFKLTTADGVARLDMVPVVRDSDSVAGLYDLVSGSFFPSSSSTAFTAGDSVGGLDADCAFGETEIGGNVTLVKNGASMFDGGGSTLAGTLKVNDGTVTNLTISSGATIDLSDRTDALAMDGISFASGATIYIDMGERKLSASTPVITWSGAPEGVSFKRPESASGKYNVWTDDTGLYAGQRGLIVIFR